MERTEAIKGNNPMKLYQKTKHLSSETKELAVGTAMLAAIVIDLRAFPALMALLAGVRLSTVNVVFAVIMAIQLAAAAAGIIVHAARYVRACRAPKKLGVLTPQEICRILEGRK